MPQHALFGRGTSLGLPMYGHTAAPPVPFAPLPVPAGQPGQGQTTQGAEIMGLIAQMAPMFQGLLSPGSYDPTRGSMGAASSTFAGGDTVHWLPSGHPYTGFPRYGAPAQAPVRGMGGRLGGGV